MVETASVLQRDYGRALQYEKNRFGGNLGWLIERYARTKQNGSYLLREGITITMIDLSRAVGVSVEDLLRTSLDVILVDMFGKYPRHDSK